jgi:CcmD family protein
VSTSVNRRGPMRRTSFTEGSSWRRSTLQPSAAGCRAAVWSAAILLFLFLGRTATAWAAPVGDYQPYTPPAGSGQISAPLFVVIAYSCIWLVLLLFVVAVWRKQRKVEEEIDDLRGRLGGER